MIAKLSSAAVAIAAAAGVLTACSATSQSAPGPPAAPAATTRQYTSCLTVLHLLNAKVLPDVPGVPANATEADGDMPDGTQVQCHLGPPMIPGYYPPQTAYGDEWQVDVFGATTTATVAGILGGKVGTSPSVPGG